MGWFNEIIAYFDHGTTSGAVVRVAFRRKGINHKLKHIGLCRDLKTPDVDQLSSN